MTDWIPPMLSKALGSSLEAIDQAALERLIGYPETDLIDFKKEFPGKSDSDKRELGHDIVQFANSTGGLIIFGIEEAGGVATRIVPMPPDERRPERAHWIDQVAVGNIVPQATIGCHSITTNDGEVLMVSVPPSIAAPHAVKVNEALKYAIRAGRGKRFLAEHEVAERYRARFDAVAEGRRLGNEIHARALKSPRSEPNTDGDGLADMRVIVSAVPDQRGHVTMQRGLATEWEAPVLAELFDFPTYDRNDSLQLSPRYRSMALESRRPFSTSTVGELNLDGSAAIGQSLTASIETSESNMFIASRNRVDGRVGLVRDDYVVADLVNIINVLCRHALRCGAQGALVVAASLHMDDPDVGQLALLARDVTPMKRVVHGSVNTSNPTEPIQRSIFPDAVVRDPAALLEAVRLIAGDLFSHFGIPEPHQFNDAGELKPNRFDANLAEPIRRWLQTP